MEADTKKGRPPRADQAHQNAGSDRADSGVNVNHPRRLPGRFESCGFTFEQLRRDGMVALLRKRRDHWPEGRWTYEVVRIQVHPAGGFMGRKYPSREGLPASSTWGIDGFSYNDREQALARFRQMRESRRGVSEFGVFEGQLDMEGAR